MEKSYDTLLQEISGLIKSKNEEIEILRWRVADLEAKLKEAEGAGKNESE